ncbi:MAG TPA: hypothetical protein PK335_07605 [Draconibacterium sp.]|nr:hypothetical protein [Draconibacterium sp.]
MEKHVNVIAALQIGLSILRLIIVAIVFVILHFVGDFADDPDAEFVLSIIANIVMVVSLVLSLPGILAGIGLFKRKEWARILTLIISVLELVNIPLGTAVGVYSIWALSQNETVELFKAS